MTFTAHLPLASSTEVARQHPQNRLPCKNITFQQLRKSQYARRMHPNIEPSHHTSPINQRTADPLTPITSIHLYPKPRSSRPSQPTQISYHHHTAPELLPPQNNYHPSLSTKPPNRIMPPPPSYRSQLQKMIHDLTTSLTDSDTRLYAATTEIYAQTPFRGIYVSLDPSSFSGEVQVQIKLPGETQYKIQWST